MAHFAPDFSKSENDFEYPDPELTFDVHSEHRNRMSGYSASSRQDCYPSPRNQDIYQAETSIAEHPHQSFTSNPWHEEFIFGQVTPTPPPLLENAAQHTKKVNREFVAYPAGRQQARRGTTGKIVCPDCGGKFTVMSSLNRHSKICKKAWQPALSQHENMKVPDAESVSALGVHPLAADEHNFVSSEGVSSVTRFNSNIYDMPKKRTRSASHDTEDSILANKLCNYNSLTAEPNWSPPAQHDQAEGLDSNFHTIPATNTSFHPSNDQTPNLTSGPYPLSPSAQEAIRTRSYVPQSEDSSANHNPLFCDVCYVTLPRRDLLQLHRAGAHGLTEEP